MPLPKADLITTQQHKRYFFQQYGAGAENDVMYSGTDGTFINVESGTKSFGDISPINVADPAAFKSYAQVGSSIDAPDFDTFSVMFLQRHGGIPPQLYNLMDCLLTVYEVTGSCKDPGILTRKVSDYIKIYSNGDPTSGDLGGGAFDSDDMVEDTFDFTALGDIYAVAGMSVGEKASTEVASEVIDIVYGSGVECAACGPNRDGTEMIYGVINNTTASPGVGPAVIYTVDGGASWTVTAISGADSNDIPKAIDIVGQYLVVVCKDATTGSYFYAEIDDITGIPGTFTQVTTGFVSGNAPNDIHVASAREVYFCGDGGYIYKSSDILSGVSVLDAADTTTNNLNRIDGDGGSVIVSVGDGAAIVYSTNSGDTFAVASNAPAAFSLDAVEVFDKYRWWVGDSEGDVYWTNNQAKTAWTELILPAATAGALATIQDIVFATDEIGYIVAATDDPTAVFFSTINGGRTWEEGSVNKFPTMDRVNRVAFPVVSNKSVAANNLAFAGLAGNGTDGIVLLGAVPIK